MVPLCGCNLRTERIRHDRQQHDCLGNGCKVGQSCPTGQQSSRVIPSPGFKHPAMPCPSKMTVNLSQEHACYVSKKAECLLKIESVCLQVRPESRPVTSRPQSLCSFSGMTHQPHLEDRVQSTTRIKDGFQETIENQCTLHNQDQGSVSRQTASQCAVCM